MPIDQDIGSVSITGRNVCHIEWNVDNYFARRQRTDVVWRSPTFEMMNVAWHLSLHPKGPAWPDTVRWIGLFLHFESRPSIHPAAFTMGVKRKDGSIYCFVEGPGRVRWHFGSHQILEHSELLKERNTIAPEGRVTFFATVCFPDNLSNTSVNNGSFENTETESTEDEDEAQAEDKFIWKTGETEGSEPGETLFDVRVMKNLSKDFRNLLLTGEDSDVTIRVKNRRFDVHRAVLAARSQVFASMFRHDMVERQEGTVDIVDCDPDAFGEFLMFLYTGMLEYISFDIGIDVYSIAAKYDVEDLRLLCLRYLSDKISVNNFCDVMSLAIAYSENELIRHATEFFVCNAEAILPNVRWQHFLTANPLQANELYMKALKSGKSGASNEFEMPTAGGSGANNMCESSELPTIGINMCESSELPTIGINMCESSEMPTIGAAYFRPAFGQTFQ